MLLIETHPRTLADTTESTLQLLAEVNHPLCASISTFCTCGKAETTRASPWRGRYVSHYHLKNVSSRERLHVFAPENVSTLQPESRVGMVPLSREPPTDDNTSWPTSPVTPGLEACSSGFGDDVMGTLSHHRHAIEQLRFAYPFGAGARRSPEEPGATPASWAGGKSGSSTRTVAGLRSSLSR